jgi:hypothetical protein
VTARRPKPRTKADPLNRPKLKVQPVDVPSTFTVASVSWENIGRQDDAALLQARLNEAYADVIKLEQANWALSDQVHLWRIAVWLMAIFCVGAVFALIVR